MPASLPACLSASLPASLPRSLPASLPPSLPPLLASLPPCLPACRPSPPPPHTHTHSHTHTRTHARTHANTHPCARRRALYAALASPDLPHSTKAPMFMSMLFKASTLCTLCMLCLPTPSLRARVCACVRPGVGWVGGGRLSARMRPQKPAPQPARPAPPTPRPPPAPPLTTTTNTPPPPGTHARTHTHTLTGMSSFPLSRSATTTWGVSKRWPCEGGRGGGAGGKNGWEGLGAGQGARACFKKHAPAHHVNREGEGGGDARGSGRSSMLQTCTSPPRLIGGDSHLDALQVLHHHQLPQRLAAALANHLSKRRGGGGGGWVGGAQAGGRALAGLPPPQKKQQQTNAAQPPRRVRAPARRQRLQRRGAGGPGSAAARCMVVCVWGGVHGCVCGGGREGGCKGQADARETRGGRAARTPTHPHLSMNTGWPRTTSSPKLSTAAGSTLEQRAANASAWGCTSLQRAWGGGVIRRLEHRARQTPRHGAATKLQRGWDVFAGRVGGWGVKGVGGGAGSQIS